FAEPESLAAPHHQSLKTSLKAEPRAAKRSMAILLLGLLIASTFLIWNHGFVPMWIEGFAEYSPTLLAMQGHGNPPPGCPRFASLTFPLAFGAYTGCAGIYFDFPASYAWLHGWTQDPYFFRLGGVVLLCLSTLLLYATLRLYCSPYVAMWAGLIF